MSTVFRIAFVCASFGSCLVFGCKLKTTSPPVDFGSSLTASGNAVFDMDGVTYHYLERWTQPRRFGEEEYLVFVRGKGIWGVGLDDGMLSINQSLKLPVRHKYMTLASLNGQLTKVAELPVSAYPRRVDESSDVYYRRCIRALSEAP